ncbi:hypothetical protein MHYP_G00355710 [Metynnis hypsauchen]
MLVAARFLSSLLLRGHSGLLPPVKLRPLYCTCCRRAVRIPAAGLEPFSVEALDLCGENKSLDSFYTPEQRETILKLLNTGSETELAGVKLLRGRKLVNMLEYRTRNGPFKDLESIVNVPLLKHKSAVIVFNSILNPDVRREKKKEKLQLAKFIRPLVDKEHLQAATSIVSIVCGTNKIAWAHVDRAVTVLDWQQEECRSFMNGTYMASSYLEDISAVVSNLPAADLFVVEKPGISLQNTTLYPVMAHLRTVEAMLFALLSPKREPGSAPKVLNMMRTTVGRHFGLMVGESRTSSAQTVRQMMTESVTKKYPRVTFPREMLMRLWLSTSCSQSEGQTDILTHPTSALCSAQVKYGGLTWPKR